jgi:sarcosine oxidase subunit alpha
MIFENNDLPGIFMAGALQRLMHQYYIRPGCKAVVMACSEKGYTIAGQLLDAGVTVAGVVDDRSEEEILSFSDAKKIKEANIPLYPGHTIISATGRRQVNGVIFKLASSSKSTRSNTEMKLFCDVLCMAGMQTPANELVFQRTCEGAYILESPNQFSRRPVINAHMRVDTDIFVAGGASGNQGVNRAWLEGKIAGLSAALDLGHGNKEAEVERDDAIELLARS